MSSQTGSLRGNSILAFGVQHGKHLLRNTSLALLTGLDFHSKGKESLDVSLGMASNYPVGLLAYYEV